MAGRMKALKRNQLRSSRSSFSVRFLSALLISFIVLINFPQPVYAAGGAYTIDWSAADPALNKGAYSPTYPKKNAAQKDPVTKVNDSGVVTAGGRLNGQTEPAALADAVCFVPGFSTNDSVESLMPKDLMLGQIVPFEVKLTITGETTPENGVMRFTGGWSTKTTSGGDFGYDPAYGVYSAFVDTSEGTDPGKDATVTKISSITANPGTNSEEIQGTIEVSGLQKGDIVVVEVWVVLKSTIGAKVTGNVQTRLIDAATVYSTPSAISTGNQTVPLLQVGDFFSNVVDMSVTKTDGADPVSLGGTIPYTITAKNNSTDTYANGVTVVDTLDPNVTLTSGTISDFGSYDASTRTITWNIGALAPNGTKDLTYSVTVDSAAPTTKNSGLTAAAGSNTIPTAGTQDIVNKVSISAFNADKATTNNTYYQPTNVTRPTGAYVGVEKASTTTAILSEGQVVPYTFTVTNIGNVVLSIDTVVDSKFGTATPTLSGIYNIGDTNTNGKLDFDPAEAWTFTGNYTVLASDLKQPTLDNTVTVTAYALDDSGNRTGSAITASDSLSIPVGSSGMTLTKEGTWNDTNNNGYAEVGETISYTFSITNTGKTILRNITLVDHIDSVSISGNLIFSLAVGASDSSTFSGTYTLTQADIDAGSFSNTATAEAGDGTEASDDVSIPLPKPIVSDSPPTNNAPANKVVTLPKSGTNGLLPSSINEKVNVPELWDSKVELIEYYLDEENIPKDATNYNNVQIAKKNLNLLGTCLQDAFDMTLMMRVTNTDGSVTVKPVDNAALLANITFLLPVTNDKLWNAPTLAAYFIADDGNVALLKSTKVTIDGKNYLEVANNHFSVYALCATCGGTPDIPKTGENDQSGTTLLGLLFVILAAAALFGLIWKRRQISSVQ